MEWREPRSFFSRGVCRCGLVYERAGVSGDGRDRRASNRTVTSMVIARSHGEVRGLVGLSEQTYACSVGVLGYFCGFTVLPRAVMATVVQLQRDCTRH